MRSTNIPSPSIGQKADAEAVHLLTCIPGWSVFFIARQQKIPKCYVCSPLGFGTMKIKNKIIKFLRYFTPPKIMVQNVSYPFLETREMFHTPVQNALVGYSG